ncbi:M67 family metallopeptidase [Halalkalibacter kiskunsagensis]|uniref:M67 family metallopeptidase n=1 Tax=Halalkalibacter kiskunsagensis TaxID=1548599 RepID=A0ABV6K9P4_9BACI
MEYGKIIIPASYYKEIVEHGKLNLPYEVCGLLAGIKDKVQSVWPLENEIKSDRRFFVGEKKIEETIKLIEKQGEKILAVFHSHPTTAPLPSSYDIENHFDEHVLMVIISYKSMNPKVKCYRIKNDSYKECPILIKPTS